MVKYPLALLPVVTITGGTARLAPPGYGASTSTGSPSQAINSWISQGAAWIHVVDQAALDGQAPGHHHIVAGRAHLQYAGQVHDDATLAAALSTGASRIVIDATDLSWANGVVSAQGDRVAVALDIRQSDVFEIATELEQSGCLRFVVSDRAEAHHWKHGDRHLLGEFCSAMKRPVMARGGISHLNDLHTLHELVPEGLDGIILDDALYDGAFTFAEAVAAGADRFDMFFWGPPGQ